MSNRPIPWFEKMAMAKGKYYELCVRSQKHYRAASCMYYEPRVWVV